VLDVNVAGKLLTYDLLTPGIYSKNPLARDIQQIIMEKPQITPWQLTDALLAKKYSNAQIFAYYYKELFNHRAEYYLRSMLDLPRVVLDRYTERGWLFSDFYSFIDKINLLTLPAVSFLFAFQTPYLTRKLRINEVILLLLLISSWYIIVVTSLFGYNEYARLSIPVLIFLHLFSFSFIYYGTREIVRLNRNE
jgi:hypothetical protein